MLVKQLVVEAASKLIKTPLFTDSVKVNPLVKDIGGGDIEMSVVMLCINLLTCIREVEPNAPGSLPS